MRQLNLSRQATDPSWAVEQAQALSLLRQLATAHSLGLTAEAEGKLLRFIVSVAAQYRASGATWESLLRAGFAGAAHCYATSAEPARWVGWWVRQKVVATSAQEE